MPKKIQFSSDMKLDVKIDLLKSREGLCVRIAQIATAWTQVEMQLAVSFAYLLGKEDEQALVLYNELIDRGIRNQVFLALARKSLPPNLIEDATALFKKVREKGKQRHEVVHAHWATSEKYPTSLIAISSKHLLTEVYKSTIARLEHGKAVGVSDSFEIFEWTDNDFAARLNNIIGLIEEAREFSKKVREHVALIRLGLT